MSTPLFRRQYPMSSVDTAAANVSFLFVPTDGGRVRTLWATSRTATTGNPIVTFAIAPPGSTTFVNITGGAITLTSAGSAAGSRFAVNPSALNGVSRGACIRATVTTTGTGIAELMAEIDQSGVS